MHSHQKYSHPKQDGSHMGTSQINTLLGLHSDHAVRKIEQNHAERPCFTCNELPIHPSSQPMVPSSWGESS